MVQHVADVPVADVEVRKICDSPGTNHMHSVAPLYLRINYSVDMIITDYQYG